MNFANIFFLNRYIKFILTIAVSCALFNGANPTFAQDDEFRIYLTEEEQLWLANNKVIRVGVDPTVTPQEAVDQDGKISGISGEYLNVISEKLGVEFVWSGSRNWSEAMSMIRSRDAEILSAASNTPERNEFLLFTDNYMTTSNAIYIRSGGAVYGTMDSLSGRKIAQIRGFSTTALIKLDFPNIEVVEVETIEDALKRVSEGDVDAYVGDIPFSARAIAREGLTNILVSGTINSYGGNAIAIRKDLPLLASALQKAVKSITSAQHEEIANIWLNNNLNLTPNFRLVWQVVFASILVMTLLVFWAFSLRREVQRRRAAEKKAEMANAAKSDFLASISHDLRTPLNAIIGFSEVLKDEVMGPIENKKYLDYSQDIHKSGKYLLQLVSEILDLTELESGKRRIERDIVDLKQIVTECTSILGKLSDDKDLTLIVDLPNNLGKVYGDHKSIMQILINLISNAIKYTPENGKVIVSIDLFEDIYILKITDTGIGIAEYDIPAVTKPFMRAEKSPYIQNSGGTGLGLAIVKSLVDLNGGTLKITSEIGAGTTVSVSMPLNAVSPSSDVVVD